MASTVKTSGVVAAVLFVLAAMTGGEQVRRILPPLAFGSCHGFCCQQAQQRIDSLGITCRSVAITEFAGLRFRDAAAPD